MIASYEARLPRYPAELIKEENESVSSQRELIENEIKALEERLELLYPESVRIAYQEQQKAAAQTALSMIASSGSIDSAQIKALQSLLTKANGGVDEAEERA